MFSSRSFMVSCLIFKSLSHFELKDLNIRHDTIKLLEENIGKISSDINCTSVFLGQSPKAIEIKTKVNKWDLVKLLRIMGNNKRKDKQQSGENIYQRCNQQRLISKTHIEFTQFNHKRLNNPTDDPGQMT